MKKYKFNISGYMEVEAENLNDALDKARFDATINGGHDFINFDYINDENEKPENLKVRLKELIKNKDADGGILYNEIVKEIKEEPQLIDEAIKKLLMDGEIYEARPNWFRWLG